jgi:DNA-binding XRE family transcriptional regulator
MKMKINWLWDSRTKESKVREILKDENHPKFDIYAEKLFSRVNDPKVAFDIVDKVTFCKKWPGIKKRMRKDRWLTERVGFWQTIYDCVLEGLKKQGVKIREPREVEISAERIKLAREIKDIRVELGYTQKDMAKKLGVIQQYISKIENGYENFSVDTLKRIADVFDKRLVVALR